MEFLSLSVSQITWVRTSNILRVQKDIDKRTIGICDIMAGLHSLGDASIAVNIPWERRRPNRCICGDESNFSGKLNTNR